TVRTIVKRFKMNDSSIIKQKTGPPSKIDECTSRRIIHQIKKDRRITLNDLHQNINNNYKLKISKATIRRMLHNNGYYKRNVKIKPSISNRIALKEKYGLQLT